MHRQRLEDTRLKRRTLAIRGLARFTSSRTLQSVPTRHSTAALAHISPTAREGTSHYTLTRHRSWSPLVYRQAGWQTKSPTYSQENATRLPMCCRQSVKRIGKVGCMNKGSPYSGTMESKRASSCSLLHILQRCRKLWGGRSVSTTLDRLTVNSHQWSPTPQHADTTDVPSSSRTESSRYHHNRPPWPFRRSTKRLSLSYTASANTLHAIQATQ